MKLGQKKCVNCKTIGKHSYKKGAKYFCTQKCKNEYYDNDIPTLITKIQPEFNRMVAKDQPCSKCGKTFETMQCSHVWSIGSTPALRFDVMNVKPLCGHCHNFWWHLEPMESRPWFKEKYPDRHEYLEFARNQFRKWTATELKEIRQAIKDQKVSKLIRFKTEYLLSIDNK